MQLRSKAERAITGMQIFAGLKGKGLLDRFEVPTAIMVVMVAMMWADKEKEIVEERQIRSICDTSPIFDKLSTTQIDKLIAESEAIVQGLGDEAACRKAATSLSPELRLTAFAFAAMVLFADGKVVDLEMAETAKLSGWLKLDSKTVTEIVRVISILRHERDLGISK